ncbi:siderophore-interacting protein [Endozoicomonas sp. Mp262]|uniref:siderophore-interacting protein n=1 Tax=Endozoicomonas sp. Mp262 TaxID=2919499 RepID=UPI0021D91530
MATSSAKSVRRPPMMLEVVRTQLVTPGMRRITLTGDMLKGFPEDSHGAHIKILLPREGQDKPVLPTLGPKGPIWPPADVRPIARTYSVRRFDVMLNELDVDFVLHGDNGPASAWVSRVQPGDFVGVAGPGGPKPMLGEAEWYLMAGDMTAIPAISALLEIMPESAAGQVFIEVPNSDEIQTIQHPAGVEVSWLIREEKDPIKSHQLINAVTALDWPSGSAFAWVAGENSSVLSIRKYLRTELKLERHQFYAVPYWRSCFTEEAYHQERHEIMDNIDT